MLKAHYQADEMTMTATELAEAAGYQNYRGANRQFANIGQMIAADLNFEPERRFDNNQPFWSSVLADGYQEDEWKWVLRPEVAQALKDLGWV
ncbi:hypothetical protein BV372_20545 [Nostoc sp. T09]|uniref:hypothetical protein n=1 Tax=Nostoc sp. T09 TaxID=1932621 RepID=UPI000A37A864|nr:hypothetical protein [Nostoc sp. T09]OUL31202.1 hypothetical protein BV372_20545 [Nostoc sp. T09]